QWPRTTASIEDPQLRRGLPARARMAAAPPGALLTVASFRTWRGSETRAAQVPTFQRRLPRPVLRIQTSATEFGPAKADCRCRVPPAPHLARPRMSLRPA